MLSHIVAEHGDYQATEIAAELMAKLYAASEEPLPSALLPIRDRFAALFQRARDDQNAGCQTDYVHAAIIADQRHCCKVSDEAAFCLIQRPYISKTLLTRRISPRGSP